jgi:NAD(P)-dependent dehydrogenase (short-subunit alcohol dehydrogenase family)
MAGRVEGKIALITGGAQGLGEAAARMLAKEGARVAITDVNIEGAQKIAASINEARKGAAIAIHHDVTQEDQWVHALAQTHKAFGGLHVLVNNAGISAGSDVETTSFEDWKRVHAIDLDSVFLGCKFAIPMIAQTV